MIYVDQPIADWLKKHPELSIAHGDCDYCWAEMVTTIPFITKDYVGLVAKPCICGKGRSIVMCLVTTSSTKHAEWSKLVE